MLNSILEHQKDHISNLRSLAASIITIINSVRTIGILTAILVVSIECTVKVFTDSQAAINGIRNMFNYRSLGLEKY